MEQVMNENMNYRVALYCRLSKDDEQTGESVSIETQKMLLTDYCVESVMTEKNLTGEVLSQLIERIEIGHIVKVGSCKQQEITIYYRFIGAVDDN